VEKSEQGSQGQGCEQSHYFVGSAMVELSAQGTSWPQNIVVDGGLGRITSTDQYTQQKMASVKA
jgi:hypothetical protein